jgi:hypothetical protein
VISASSGRFGVLLRWLGLTLVVLLALQLTSVMLIGTWEEPTFQQLLVERLISQAPMALMGLLLILLGCRLDVPHEGRTPLRWLVAVLAAVLAIGLALAVPVTVSADGSITAQTEQNLATKRGQLEMAKQQSNWCARPSRRARCRLRPRLSRSSRPRAASSTASCSRCRTSSSRRNAPACWPSTSAVSTARPLL